MLEHVIALDKNIFLFCNAVIANPVFDLFFTHITERDFWIIPILLASIVFIFKEKKKALIVIGLAILTVAITDPLCVRVLKELVQRHRPCDPCCIVEGGRFLLGHKDSLSFPSAHAMNVFGQAALFSRFYSKHTRWFVVIAALIAFSRVYTGVHYPFDILAGAILGTIVGFFVHAAYSKAITLLKKHQTYQRNSGQTIPGTSDTSKKHAP